MSNTLNIIDITDLAASEDWGVAQIAKRRGQYIYGVSVSGFFRLSQEQVNDSVKNFEISGITWAQVDSSWLSPIAKFISIDLQDKIEQKINAKIGDTILITIPKSKNKNQAFKVALSVFKSVLTPIQIAQYRMETEK